MFTFVTSCCSPHISTSQQKSSTECLIWCQSGCVRILPFDRLRGFCHSTVSDLLRMCTWPRMQFAKQTSQHVLRCKQIHVEPRSPNWCNCSFQIDHRGPSVAKYDRSTPDFFIELEVQYSAMYLLLAKRCRL